MVSLHFGRGSLGIQSGTSAAGISLWIRALIDKWTDGRLAYEWLSDVLSIHLSTKSVYHIRNNIGRF